MSTTNFAELRANLGPLAEIALPHLRGPQVTVKRGMVALSKAHDAELDTTGVLAPGVELFGYQRAGVVFAEAQPNCVIGYGMGLGKTLIAITVMARNGGRWLVVAPPTLVRNWQREISKFAPQLRTAALVGETPTEIPTDVDVVIIGDSVVASWASLLAEYGFDSIIVDEFQRFKSRDAQRVEAVISIARWVPGFRIGLTGTFTKNSPVELLSPMRIIGVLDDVFGGVNGFLDQHFPRVIPEDPTAGRYVDDLVGLHDTMADSFYARLTMDEVRYQYGDKAPQGVLRNPVAITITGPAAVALKAARTDFASYLRSIDRNVPEKRAEALVKLGELRKLSGLAKVDAAVEYVQQLVDQGDQVIVFANHRAVTQAMAKAFDAPTIVGGDNIDAIEAGKDAFQAGTKRVIVANIAAGGVGHTLTAAKHVVFVEFGWSPSDMEQAEARAARFGQLHLVQSHWLVGTNGETQTTDERQFDLLNGKATITGLINDGKASTMITLEAVQDALMDWEAAQ